MMEEKIKSNQMFRYHCVPLCSNFNLPAWLAERRGAHLAKYERIAFHTIQ